jgi:xanthine dehydrogenase accessory factor
MEDGGIHRDGPIHEDGPLPAAILKQINTALERNQTAFLLSVGDWTFFLEPFQELGVLMVFGAGHVSQPTAAYGTHLGFRVIVLDDRIEFANRERFPEPIEIKVLPDFKNCIEGFNIDDDYYLVIVTRGHLHDKIVLAQALKTRAGYIGMIGSQQKRDSIYQALLSEGFSTDDIQRVHSPIGLPIGAQTPEEIAISITAELIQVRALKKNEK